MTLWSPSGTAVIQAPDHQELDAIVPDGMGGATLIWRDFRSRTNYDLYAQRIGPDGAPQWAPQGILIAQCAYDQFGAAALQAGGRTLVAWSDARNGEDFYVYSQVVDAQGTLTPSLPPIAAGVPWHAFNHPISLTAPPATLRFLYGVPDQEGGAVVCWARAEPAILSDFRAQRLSGEGTELWESEGVPLLDRTANVDMASLPRFVPDGAGGAILVWTEYTASSRNVYVQRISSQGAVLWASGGVPVEEDTSPRILVGAVPDGAGGVFVFWDPFSPTGTATDGLYAQRIDASGMRAWSSGGVLLSSDPVSASNFAASPDGEGGVVLAWIRSVNESGNVQSFLRARRLDSNGSWVWDAETSVAEQSGYWRSPRIVPSGAGTFILSWQAPEQGQGRIVVQKLNSAGIVQWDPRGTVGTPEDRVCEGGLLAPDAEGGAFLAFFAIEPGDPFLSRGIYLSRISASGSLLWDSSGIQVAPPSDYFSLAHLAGLQPDGAGGAYVAWVDPEYRDRLRLQRLNGAGQALFGPSGLPLSSAFGPKESASLLADGRGGVLGLWLDGRRAHGRIGFAAAYPYTPYFQRVTASGTP